MIPDPLHPGVVHIPVAVAIVIPFMILLSFVLVRRGAGAFGAWLPVALLSLFLFAGALVAKNTGEEQEEKVEEVVPREEIHEHEENAELFTVVAGILFALSLGGLLSNRIGTGARYAAAGVSLAMVFFAFQTGHSGGELVYEHGAASAYTSDDAANGMRAAPEEDHEDEDRENQ